MLFLRNATLDDAQTLFDWRNDPLTRAMSKTSEAVEWEKHLCWLSLRISRQEPHLYIAEINGTPAGTLRIDGDALSYTVAPNYRNRRVATRMLQWARSEFGVLRAEIKPENIASIRAAERAGHAVELLTHEDRPYLSQTSSAIRPAPAPAKAGIPT
jgi:RimJ/RimL family protein N-acetyltransferase